MSHTIRFVLPSAILLATATCAQEQPTPDATQGSPVRDPNVEVLPGQVEPTRASESERPVIESGVLDAKRAADLVAPLEVGTELSPGWVLREPAVFAEEMQIRIVNGDKFIAVRCMRDDGKLVGVAKSKSFVIELGLAGIDHAEAQPIAKQVIDAVVKNDPGGLELAATGR